MATPIRPFHFPASVCRAALRRIESRSCSSSSSGFTAFTSRPTRSPTTLQPTLRGCTRGHVHVRSLHTTPSRRTTVGHNRERVPDEAPTTDFERMDMLGQTPAPATSIDVCMYDGFGLNSGVKILDGNGALLVNGEAFIWRPWRDGKKLLNHKGQWDVPAEAFGLFDLVWPRPDLLILGLGREIRPLSPDMRKVISSLGMRVEVLDTRNAASQFNMLATERGVNNVAAALIPIGWREGVGCV